MATAPPIPFLRRGRKRLRVHDDGLAAARAGTRETVQQIEIVAPDRYSGALLLEYAVAVFPGEIVPGSWVVRLQPPPAGGQWVVELLALVERWLQAAPLPSATVRYGGRSYLIRSSNEAAATGLMH